MSSMSKPNPAAVALGKSRWEGISPEDRRSIMSALAKRAAKKLGKAGRQERARKAGSAKKKKRKPPNAAQPQE
jgi:predicted Fe-S protein YdhL (DUF1289 family)